MRNFFRHTSGVVLGAVLALAAAGAMAAGSGPRDPYNVPPGGKLILDKTETRMQKADICRHEAAYKHLGDSFIRSCEGS